MKAPLNKVFRYCLLLTVLIIALPSLAQQFTFRNGWGQPTATAADRGRTVCTDASGNVYIAGQFYINPATPIDFGGGSLTSAGSTDGFVAKFNSSGVHQWSIRFGSSLSSEEAFDIATDGSFVYVTGVAGAMTVGTSGTIYPLAGGGLDGFVMKLDAATAAVSWVTRFGGFNTDEGQSVCLDPSGNVYLSGIFRTNTTNTTATFGSFTRTVQGNFASYSSDMFVAKLNSAGVFQWVSTGGHVGGNDNINASGGGSSICYVPSLGEVVVVGNNRSNGSVTAVTYSTASPASSVSLNNVNATLNEDFVLLEVNAGDGTFISGVNVGGNNNEGGLGITYDSNIGDVFFCGYFYSPSIVFPGSSAITNGSSGVRANGMFGRYNPSTNAFTWIKEIANTADGSAADDNVRGITSNNAGGIYITGNFAGTTSFADGATGISVTTGGLSDVFLAKVNASNGNAQWVRQGSGTSGFDIGYGVAYGSGGASVWITGNYATTMTFSPLTGLTSPGDNEAVYLVKLADQPTVSSVNVPANGSYNTGDNLDFTVNWNAAVTVTGSPYITLTVGASSKNATYLSGSGTTALVFRYTVAVADNDNDGIVVGSLITLNSGTITNTASTGVNALLGLNSVGSTSAVLVDGVAPTVNSINRQTPSTASTNATSVVYRITFSESVSGVDITDFSLTATSTAAGSVASVSAATGTTIDVTVNSVAGDGTLRLDLKASGTGISDAAGNPISGGYTSGQTYTLDHTVPSVSSINRQTPSAASTSATALVYRVTFSESVSNVDINDFSLVASLTAAGTIASVSSSSGSTIDVSVNSVTGDGTLRLDLKASGTGIVDAVNNAISGGFTTGQSYTLDHSAPSVSSINRQTPSNATTNATSVVYRVTFSESVSNVDITDFNIITTLTATGTISAVSASSGTTIDVTVNAINGNGTIRLDLKANGTGIVDGVNNAISGGFTTGQTYTIDVIAPSVSSINRQTPSTSTTNATTLVYRVTFSESVFNVDISDFSLIATGTAAGSIASISASSGITIDVTVNSATGDGTLRLDLKASGTGITDAAGNAIGAGYTSGQTYTLDHTIPTVSSIIRLAPSTQSTNTTSVIYRITFSEIVAGVDITDFSLTTGGTASGNIVSVSSPTGTTIDVTINSVAGDGTLRLDLKSSTNIVDGSGNAVSGYTSGEAYTIDHTAPSVISINRQNPAGASTTATTLVWRVTFSENVLNVDISDFSLTGTGSATGTIASVSASSGTTIDVSANSVSGAGTLRLDLNASSTAIVDDVSNAIGGGYSSGEVYTLATPGLWTGNTSTDYNLAANWDDNTVPTGSTDITIPTGATRMPVLTAASAANNISLQNATTLSLGGFTLTVNGNISISGTGKFIGSATSTLNMLGTGASTLDFDQSTEGTSNALANLTVNGLGAVNTLNSKLNIYTLLTLTSGNLNLNGNTVVMRSTSIANTAMVAPVAGTITYGSGGKFVAERFIPLGKRAYRLLAPGVSGSVNGSVLSTIHQNWQNSGTHTAGIGTHITGNGSNGTDATASGQASMFTYTAGSPTFASVTSTSQANDTLSAIRGYRLFIRGDRSPANITTANNTGAGTPNIDMNLATTLSASGRLLVGTIVFDRTGTSVSGADGWTWETPNAPLTTNIAGNNYSLVPNPYLAMLDWNSVTLHDLSTTYYVWDPNKNLRGGYESYNRTTGIASALNASRYIQPGQSFFVQTTGANPSLTITEADKNITAANLLNAFRTGSRLPRLDIRLAYSSRATVIADNCMVVFDNAFDAAQGQEDSYKFLNPDDNIMIMRNSMQLGIEGRPLTTANDTIPLRLQGLQDNMNYNLTILTANFRLPVGYVAYLEDSYDNTSVEIQLTSTTVKQFTYKQGNTAYSDRFRIVIRKNALMAQGAASMSIYPNPAAGGRMVLRLRSMEEGRYTLVVYNMAGQHLISKNIQHAGGDGEETLDLQRLSSGIYRVRLQSSRIKFEQEVMIP